MTLSTEPHDSNATDTGTGTATVPPIRREVMVGVPPETAFALFTAHIGKWWPLGRHSVFGEDALVAFEGDRLVERLGDQSSVWGEVTTWDPPHTFELTWHPGRSAEVTTDLALSFAPLDEGTLVTLVHSGWERTESPAEAAAEYSQGWLAVLGLFAAMATTIDHGLSVVDRPGGSQTEPDRSTPDATDDADAASHTATDAGTWYALVHTPGPALPDGASIFAHPAFADHLAFLEQLRERGLLVAAGPVFPERGEGMTVVRVLPEHGDVDVAALARTEDASVAGGFLEVEVRPWSVRLSG